MSAIQKIESAAIAPINDGAALLAAISNAATNPQFNGENMDRLLSVYERIESRKAESAYAEAFSAMQIELPAIAERGNAAGRYTFAKWEDINTAIKPVLAKHGFALSFRTDFGDGIAITGVLQHRAGHREETTIKLPADASGNKNAVQAVASSVSYGKRYTAGALLNLTSHGEDDDAYSACGTYDATGWYDAINDASSMDELNRTANELRNSDVPEAAKRSIRAKWSARAKELRA